VSALLLAVVWWGVALVGIVMLAVFERRGRLATRLTRPVLAPPRSLWGGDSLLPPARSLTVRSLAGFARLIRSRTRIRDDRLGLRRVARGLGVLTLALGFALLPILPSPSPVLLDLEHGLIAIVLFLVLQAFARTILGLSERSAWSRLGAVQQSNRAIASVALLALVLAPIALEAGSLRLQTIVADQARPLEWLIRGLGSVDAGWGEALGRRSIPAWNLFVQPITALLFLPAMGLWTLSPRVDDPSTGSIELAGSGLDADSRDLYWTRLEARAVSVLGAGLFVTLFLGAGDIPFLNVAELIAGLTPYFGDGLPRALGPLLGLGSFVFKLLIMLALSTRVARSLARARDDRSLQLTLRRLVPLAWANLLLVAALAIWIEGRLSGGAG
jgi:NADH:ubiquinone oxidoreductase subunit H